MAIYKTIFPTLALFGSLSTLICCALPALLVSLGAGAVMIGLVSAVPQLVWLSEHKVMLFSFAGVMLTISGISRFMSRNAACPVDPLQAKSCTVREIVRNAFIAAGIPAYGPHSFRHMLTHLGEEHCSSPAELKAWSQNLGHEHVATTLTSYGTLDKHTQGKIINSMKNKKGKENISDYSAQEILDLIIKEKLNNRS